jgi:hypothetical protein
MKGEKCDICIFYKDDKCDFNLLIRQYGFHSISKFYKARTTFKFRWNNEMKDSIENFIFVSYGIGCKFYHVNEETEKKLMVQKQKQLEKKKADDLKRLLSIRGDFDGRYSRSQIEK